MSCTKPKRRWLQFSLRSVLLLTLAVALWLGYEVRQTRHVERTIVALRALGGNAECEPTGWSLLRLCRVPGYGRRIVRAEVPGTGVEESIELLRGVHSLREVQVMYDGTYDPTPSWQLINRAFGDLVAPKPISDEPSFRQQWYDDERQWKNSVDGRRLARICARIVEAYPQAQGRTQLHVESAVDLWLFRPTRYHLYLLEDGSLAELLIREELAFTNIGDQDCFAALLVEDRCVGVRGFSTSNRRARPRIIFEDLDGDALVEVAFDGGSGRHRPDDRVRQLPGDPRNWLGVYKIERDGFKSLLPEDKSDFP